MSSQIERLSQWAETLIKELKDKHNMYWSTLRDFKMKWEYKEAELSRKTEEVNKLEEHTAGLKKQVESLARQLHTKEEDSKEIKTKIQDLHQKLEKAESNNTDAILREEALKHHVSELEERFKLQKENNEKKLESASGEIQQVQSKLELFQRKLEDNQEMIQAYIEKNTTLEQQISSLNASLSRMQAQKNKSEQELTSTKACLVMTNNSLKVQTE